MRHTRRQHASAQRAVILRAMLRGCHIRIAAGVAVYFIAADAAAFLIRTSADANA